MTQTLVGQQPTDCQELARRGDSWAALLGADKLAEGRVWAAVPVWTVVGPELSRRLNSRR